MREFWREWVVNYDFAHQRTLTTQATNSGRQMIERGRRWVRQRYFALALERGRLEQSTVEVGDVAVLVRRGGALAAFGVEAAEEERREHGRVEVAAVPQRRVEAIDDEAPLAGQPAFLLDEVEEEETREDEQRLLRVAERAGQLAGGAFKSLEKLS